MANVYKNIAVAVDGSKEAEWALSKAISICKRDGAHLFIVHVIDTRNFANFEAYDMSYRERAEDFAQELLSKYTQQAEAAGVAATAETELGSPKVQITRATVKKHEIDLIVCGATGLSAVERFLIGSVSEHVVRTAPCDVLVIRTEKE